MERGARSPLACILPLDEGRHHGSPFQAFGRLLSLCSPVERRACQELEEATPRLVIEDLDDGVLIALAAFLDPTTLGSLDATCRRVRELNRALGGPWHSHGLRAYRNLELVGDGAFELDGVGRSLARVDWKSRCSRFSAEVPTFRDPFIGAEITSVSQADEIAYCRCCFRTDHLDGVAGGGGSGTTSAGSHACLYMEVEVVANPDNVSLAVVDFEDGGCSSVTFSPDTGAVIRERKVCETPRKVEGAYIQPLGTTTPGLGFEGAVGVFLHKGHLAFFRRHVTKSGEGGSVQTSPWESTGFVTDLSWAEGQRLTPCLAFRNEGEYHVRMVRVGTSPPLVPERNAMAYNDMNWSSLDWDAGQEEEQHVEDM